MYSGFFDGMFTGIITHLGRVTKKNNETFAFKTSQAFLRKVRKGDSVAINGVCLTVTGKPAKDSFFVDVMPETQRRTTLTKLKIGDIVNLELPATSTAFLSGHIVQGHIDGVGKILAIKNDGNSRLLMITVPANLTRFIVEKGSIAVNGVSLTIVDVTKTYLTVGIIPNTWQHTTFYTLKVGDSINIEVDVIAKYVHSITRL